MSSKIYHIVNMQCTAGQPHKGVALSNTQIMELLPKKVRDIQKIPQAMFEKNPAEVLLKCIESQRKWQRTLFFGGDHYASFFTVLSSLAIHGNKFRLIWLDAHGDIHNMKTSPSGNRHGMPVRFLMEHSIPGIPQLQPHQIFYVGVRDLERAEWNYIHRHKIRYIKAADAAADSTLREIAKFVRGHKVHFSLDVDVLDPAIMPCTGTPAAGGLQLETLLAIYDTIHQYGGLVAVDVMEYIGTSLSSTTFGRKGAKPPRSLRSHPHIPSLEFTNEEKRMAKQTMRTILHKIVEF